MWRTTRCWPPARSKRRRGRAVQPSRDRRSCAGLSDGVWADKSIEGRLDRESVSATWRPHLARSKAEETRGKPNREALRIDHREDFWS